MGRPLPDAEARPEEPRGVESPEDPLTGVPFLVKVDRYGSVSALSRVETPLGFLVIVGSNEAGSFEPSFELEGRVE